MPPRVSVRNPVIKAAAVPEGESEPLAYPRNDRVPANTIPPRMDDTEIDIVGEKKLMWGGFLWKGIGNGKNV